jgi:hypothetical protein
MSSYPTQEDELRAKEAEAENLKSAEESRFLSAFQTVPKKNGQRLSEQASAIVGNFNSIMSELRQEPYERQENLMAGLKRLFEEQVNVIDARYAYTVKINPSTAATTNATTTTADEKKA